MIDAKDVAAIVVTRGDVDLDDVCEPLAQAGLSEVLVWDNARDENLSVYGRYAAIEHVTATVVLVVDDDVALSQDAIDGLLAAYEPGTLVANMPAEYRGRYPDSALVGFGSVFDRDLPDKAFARFRAAHPRADNDWFLRTCDIIFAMLTPRLLVDLPFEMLPHTFAANRMYRTKGNTYERQRMTMACGAIRDGK